MNTLTGIGGADAAVGIKIKEVRELVAVHEAQQEARRQRSWSHYLFMLEASLKEMLER